MASRFEGAVLRPWQKALVDRLRSETTDYNVFHAHVPELAGKSWLLAWAATQPDFIVLDYSKSVMRDLIDRVEEGWEGIILLEASEGGERTHIEHNNSVLRALLDVKQGFLQVGKKHKTIEPPQICVPADRGEYYLYRRLDRHIVEFQVEIPTFTKMNSDGYMEAIPIGEPGPDSWVGKWSDV